MLRKKFDNKHQVSCTLLVSLSSPYVVGRVMPTHFIRQFLLHFPNDASLSDIAFQLGSTHGFVIQSRKPWIRVCFCVR